MPPPVCIGLSLDGNGGEVLAVKTVMMMKTVVAMVMMVKVISMTTMATIMMR